MTERQRQTDIYRESESETETERQRGIDGVRDRDRQGERSGRNESHRQIWSERQRQTE